MKENVEACGCESGREGLSRCRNRKREQKERTGFDGGGEDETRTVNNKDGNETRLCDDGTTEKMTNAHETTDKIQKGQKREEYLSLLFCFVYRAALTSLSSFQWLVTEMGRKTFK
mmetsp:Transcript_23322/g.45892  ORF Transcript_23322/g.45892 Transcript_23322/m.45892 type:complete len:115 (-) Transcript_23322:3054-3398(-)